MAVKTTSRNWIQWSIAGNAFQVCRAGPRCRPVLPVRGFAAMSAARLLLLCLSVPAATCADSESMTHELAFLTCRVIPDVQVHKSYHVVSRALAPPKLE